QAAVELEMNATTVMHHADGLVAGYRQGNARLIDISVPNAQLLATGRTIRHADKPKVSRSGRQVTNRFNARRVKLKHLGAHDTGCGYLCALCLEHRARDLEHR